MTMLQHSVIESGGYNIDRSLRFRSSASAYLSRTLSGSPTNNLKWTLSFWFKRSRTGTDDLIFGSGNLSTVGAYVRFDSNNNLNVYFYNGSFVFNVSSSAVYRDPSAWYHAVVVYDSANATASNRILMYVNGVQITSFAVTTYPSLNQSSPINTNTYSSYVGTPSGQLDGYLADVNFIDGQALTPSSFGQTDAVTGVWVPKKYTGTYGTNGFYLNFSDNTSATTLAYDKSGNGNNWTANNISVTAGATYDSMTDVPTLTSATAANYCVLNPLNAETGMTGTLASGNLDLSGSGGKRSTIAVQSGKWYWEFRPNSGASANFPMSGIYVAGQGTYYPGYDGNSFGYFQGGSIYYNGSTALTVSSYTDGDVLGFAWDANTGKVYVAKNGSWQNSGDPVAGTGQVATISTGVDRVIGAYNSSGSCSINFGQRPFSYTPPTGFKALNTFNLPDPTIKKPNQYMDATTYAGTGVSGLVVTNTGGFQPDLVWTKQRNGTDYGRITDAVRGVGKQLVPSVTDAESSFANVILSLNSNGFTVGDKTDVNYNGYNYVGWQWKESATAGFDIVTYTGTGSARTVSHSLGVAPKMIIVKCRSTTYSWSIWHNNIPNSQYLLLNTTGAVASDGTMWNNTSPTASNFSVGTNAYVNLNSQTYVAYLFAEIAGFSKFGSYTGNGSADGPFVYCGFRPKYVMIKNATRSTSYTSWQIIDTSREPYNIGSGTVPSLWANNSAVEGTRGVGSGTDSVNYMDVLSNGFKIRSAASDETNDNTQTFVYAAFAENPFKYSNAR